MQQTPAGGEKDASPHGVLDAIGNTPLIRLRRAFRDPEFHLYAKLETANPGGSIKDRAALRIIREALREGRIRPGSLVVESSSGNMGIGLAQACRYYGLRFVCVVDPRTNRHLLKILEAYGARVEMVEEPHPQSGDFLSARLERVRELIEGNKESFWPNQYANLQNAQAHWKTMEEIAVALDGKVDHLYCATSTCGTIRGCIEYAQANRLAVKIYAVDAVGSVIFGGKPGKRMIPGHGAAVRPALTPEAGVERVIYVSDADCVAGCRRLLESEAILAGGSSGAVLVALKRMRHEIEPGSNCVLILPDRGERYLETIYSDAWVEDHLGEIRDRWDDDNER